MATQAKPRTWLIVFASIGVLVELSAFILTASEEITVRAGLRLALIGLVVGFIPTFLIRRRQQNAKRTI
jgi:hypothetical protein